MSVPTRSSPLQSNAAYADYFRRTPTREGYFGKYGGALIPPALESAMHEVRLAYETISRSHEFISELRRIRRHFQGRPTPVYHAARLSRHLGGSQIYFKREDLNHTGAHKINHCMGEGLLAKHMGKKKIIAETGAGQHGVALATAAAYFGLECDIYMGEVDIAKQAPNVARMKILGTRVIPVTRGQRTLKEAVDACLEAYREDSANQIYCIGSVVGPHPFPMMVRDFQRVVGVEAREQFIEMTGNLPDIVTACVGGGSNAMGLFSGFLADPCEIHGVEPLGKGPQPGEHSATLTYGKEGTIHGFRCYLLQDAEGQPAEVHSVASGLDYPGVGPEHCHLMDAGRVQYTTATDEAAIEAFFMLSRMEGIIPALESAHAVAHAIRLAREAADPRSILVNLSGRGDKDMDYVIEHYGTGGRYVK
ncbi:MAG: tryptophan synthase subunit beta [Sterolibacteriaceae bacterium]|nr:tryptophan synthase subunit beta [Sterolibacteriaceae bacterium]MBK9085091.1 tryptophan synthase subunit beta [Sterolibacteriaceae bacterium]